MRETELQQFLAGTRDASWLKEAIRSLHDRALVADLEAPAHISCADLIRLCDAHLEGGVPAPGLEALATAILGSDRLVWDETSLEGELVAEVLWDWSSPESGDGLTTGAIALHRKLLAHPPKPRLTSPN